MLIGVIAGQLQRFFEASNPKEHKPVSFEELEKRLYPDPLERKARADYFERQKQKAINETCPFHRREREKASQHLTK